MLVENGQKNKNYTNQMKLKKIKSNQKLTWLRSTRSRSRHARRTETASWTNGLDHVGHDGAANAVGARRANQARSQQIVRSRQARARGAARRSDRRCGSRWTIVLHASHAVRILWTLDALAVDHRIAIRAGADSGTGCRVRICRAGQRDRRSRNAVGVGRTLLGDASDADRTGWTGAGHSIHAVAASRTRGALPAAEESGGIGDLKEPLIAEADVSYQCRVHRAAALGEIRRALQRIQASRTRADLSAANAVGIGSTLGAGAGTGIARVALALGG